MRVDSKMHPPNCETEHSINEQTEVRLRFGEILSEMDIICGFCASPQVFEGLNDLLARGGANMYATGAKVSLFPNFIISSNIVLKLLGRCYLNLFRTTIGSAALAIPKSARDIKS